MDEGQ